MPESRLEALVTADVASGVRGLAEVAGTVDRLSTAVEASARTMVNQGRDAVGATASVRGLKDQVELLTRAEQEQVTTIRIADEQWAMLAATHRNRVNPAHEQTVGGLRNLEQAAKSTEAAVGKMGEAGGMAVSRMSGLAAMAGGGAGMIAGGAALVGGGLAFEAGKAAIENAEKQERSLRSLEQAATVTGQSFASLAKRTDEWIQSNRSLISDQFDTREAMALFVRAGNDEETTLKAMGAALDLANLKQLGIKESARMVELAMMGNGRAIREMGIDLKSLNTDTDVSETAIKELERAQTAAAKATTEHTNAARALSEMQDSLRGKHTLTQIEVDKLQDAQNKVAAASKNQSAAAAEVVRLQGEVGTSTAKSAVILEELSGKVAGTRDNLTTLQRSQNELRNTWQSLSADSGPQLIAILTGAARVTDGFLQGLSGKSKEGKEGWDGINNAAVGAAKAVHGIGEALGLTGPKFDAAAAAHARFTSQIQIAPRISTGTTDRDDMRSAGEAVAAFAINMGRLGDRSSETSQQIRSFRDESDRTSTSAQTMRDRVAWLSRELEGNAGNARLAGQAVAQAASDEGRALGVVTDSNRLAASAWDWNRKAMYDAEWQTRMTTVQINNIKEAVTQANRDRLEIKVEASALDRLQQRIREISTQEFTLHFRDEHERSAFADPPSGAANSGGEVPYWGNGV